MTRPTPEESKTMEVNRQIKEIWQKRIGKNKNELKPIYYREFAWVVSMDKKSVSISKGKIENLLSKSNTPEMREDSILKVIEELKYLIE